jgi:hypothetical protein
MLTFRLWQQMSLTRAREDVFRTVRRKLRDAGLVVRLAAR